MEEEKDRKKEKKGEALGQDAGEQRIQGGKGRLVLLQLLLLRMV